ncbi:AbrB family transcriptional regulator [Albimonas sp. CAU 1670]|uniref:AbrB family transcriptional regulator n=1 Tax=Albimonas sp. CAU 1670 TaxID=3032599 RepID=UPI0023DACF17|nr:AbrB family transcriptional regulator [Albimonas sp. CAU 1670]MDF2232390.1 AbrB family transcriptional regulator [Albimonas sp. CAU 1670]
MASDLRTPASTLAAGLAGAALAALAGVPAGALIGSTLAVVALAASGRSVGLPNRLRDVAFATIGVSLGSGVDERLVDQFGAWAVSLSILTISLVATLAAGRLILTRGFGLDARTATLASSPGTMSNAIAMAAEGHGDATAVMFLQVMRLLVLVLAVPPLAVALGGSAQGADLAGATMPPAAFALLLAAALALGFVGARAGLPAACLLAGMVVSAAGHATGLVHGAAPAWAIFAAFATTGAALSARMSKVTAAQARRHALAGLAIVTATLVLSLGFALLAQAATGLAFAQVWIAYAPGGVEAMAAIGLSLGYDPAYVAVHHFVRIFVLVLIVPVALRL